MARKHSFSRLCAVFLLLALLCTAVLPFCTHAEESEPTLQDYLAGYAANESPYIDVMLKTAMGQKALALEAAGNTANAALLRGLTFHPHRIAVVEAYYSLYYVKGFEKTVTVAEEIIDLLSESFHLDKLTTPELVTDALVLCYVHAIDDVYASYANEDAYVAPEDVETEYVGIGVTVELLTSGYAKVIEVANGSPAEEAGIRLGDIIVAVDGEDFAALGYDNAVNKIRGEEGTEVTVTVERDGEEEPLCFPMIRKKLSIRTVSSHVIEESEERIGYIRISKFDATTFAQFVEAVVALEAEDVTSFVFDVRQNPGGRLDVVVAILDYILPDDTGAPIVRLQYSYGTEIIKSIVDCFSDGMPMVEAYGYTAALNHKIDKKMTVLCDSYTVSAAELFTSCLKDFGVSEVFGTTTYGKGMGQSELTIPFSYTGTPTQKDIACIRVSTFYYSPPVSENYEGFGVVPHHEVALSEDLTNAAIYDLTYETDLPLQAAVAFIESGAPLTAGKVDLTPDKPSAPSQKPQPPAGADEEKEPHSPAYILSFWIVFSVLAATSAALLAVGLRKRYTEKETDPLFAAESPASKAERSADEAGEQTPPIDDQTDNT